MAQAAPLSKLTDALTPTVAASLTTVQTSLPVVGSSKLRQCSFFKCLAKDGVTAETQCKKCSAVVHNNCNAQLSSIGLTESLCVHCLELALVKDVTANSGAKPPNREFVLVPLLPIISRHPVIKLLQSVLYALDPHAASSDLNAEKASAVLAVWQQSVSKQQVKWQQLAVLATGSDQDNTIETLLAAKLDAKVADIPQHSKLATQILLESLVQAQSLPIDVELWTTCQSNNNGIVLDKTIGSGVVKRPIIRLLYDPATGGVIAVLFLFDQQAGTFEYHTLALSPSGTATAMDTKNDLKKETAVIVQAQGVDTSIPVMKEPSSMAKPSITGSFQGQVKLEESKTQETPAAGSDKDHHMGDQTVPGIDEDKQAVLGAPANHWRAYPSGKGLFKKDSFAEISAILWWEPAVFADSAPARFTEKQDSQWVLVCQAPTSSRAQKEVILAKQLRGEWNFDSLSYDSLRLAQLRNREPNLHSQSALCPVPPRAMIREAALKWWASRGKQQPSHSHKSRDAKALKRKRENDSGLSDENDDELAEQGKNMPSASARVAKKLKADLNKKLKTMEKQMNAAVGHIGASLQTALQGGIAQIRQEVTQQLHLQPQQQSIQPTPAAATTRAGQENNSPRSSNSQADNLKPFSSPGSMCSSGMNYARSGHDMQHGFSSHGQAAMCSCQASQCGCHGVASQQFSGESETLRGFKAFLLGDLGNKIAGAR